MIQMQSVLFGLLTAIIDNFAAVTGAHTSKQAFGTESQS